MLTGLWLELTEAQQLQDDCDVQATNIILHGLPPDVYALANHQEADKDIWDKVKLLMKGTELSYQERKCRLYNLFDKIAFIQGETLYEYYWRFSHLINDMHTNRMTMQQVQVNTKFLNALPPEWSKFVTNVTLAKSLYTTNYDQLYAYLIQHKRHANEVRLMRERYSDPLALQGEDLIDCINKAMEFLYAVASRFPPSNNQLRTSSNPRNQATIQDGRVTIQQVQGRQTQSFAGTGNRGIATTSRGNYETSQPRVVKCYNYQVEGYMARHYTQPKRPRNYAWFKEKLMLVKAQEADCDDISSPKAVLMANLSSCDSDALSKYLAFERHLEEIYVTWAHLEKKRIRLRTNTKTLEDLCSQSLETVDENPIRTLGDYSKPSHKGYRNTIELLVGNNVVPLRSVTIWLVQNGCSFHGLWSEDTNHYLKDFLKLLDSLDLDGENRERTRLHLFQFSFHDQAGNWLECLLAGSITTWEDLTTRFLAQFFLLGRTAKLRNDMLMFQQNHRLVSRTYSKKSLIMASIVGFKSKFLMIMSPFILSLSPQPQALGTTFEAQVRDYMASHTERMKRFKNAIFKQREEINKRMTEMFRLLKKLTTSRTPEKVLIREEAKFPVTMNVNSISLARGEEERSDKTDETLDNTVKPTVTDTEIPMKEAERNNETKNKPIKKAEEKEVVEVLSSRPLEYYLKHMINEKLIKGLVYNNRFNDSLSRARVGKVNGKTYNVLPRGPVYEAMIKKKITKKEDIGGYFKIPCSIGGLKHVIALVDQGSDVNIMPYSTYMKLTDERLAEIDIRLSLASHLYIYPLGIAEDILVEVAKHVYPVDFVILDIKENEERPFILGTPFLITAKAVIKFDKGTITLRSGKSKISFHRIPDSPCIIEKGVKNDIEPMAHFYRKKG
ncbi:MAK10-like protein [Tanacetum coccineum]